MILDALTTFGRALAMSTAATGRALIGDVIPLGAPNRKLGSGKPLFLVIRVTTSFTSGGAATVSFELSSDAQAAIAVDGSETIHWASAAIAKATLVAGYTVAVIPLPLSPNYETFLGIVQNVGVAALTAGAIDAFLTENPGDYAAFPNAT